MRHKNLNQSGAVSMMSVVIFAIIITVVATAYIRSVVSQQKNAFDFDLSTRAYYAAESGAQDAVRALNNSAVLRASGKTDCTPAPEGGTGIVGANSDYGLSYTCQIITPQPPTIEGTTEPNTKTAMFKIEPATNVVGPYKLVVRWSGPASDTNSFANPREDDQMTFTPKDSWVASSVHSLLRVSVITLPRTGSFNRSAVQQRVVFLNPTNSANKGTQAELRIDNNSLEPQMAELVNNAECYSSDPSSGDTPPADFGRFYCKQTIRLNEGYDLRSTGKTMYVRVGSLYRSADFDITLTTDTGTVIPLANSQALVDVTGKSGENTFRRIRQTFSLGGYFEDTMPDAALISGEGICKLYSITTNPAAYDSRCNPLTD